MTDTATDTASIGAAEQQTVTVDGVPIAVSYRPSGQDFGPTPLLVAVHGGTYSSAYFDVAGGPWGSFLEIAARNGFSVLTVDRPGYGDSGSLPDDANTFARQAELLDGAVGQALQRWSADSVVLVGHSIGGMICLEIAARRPSWPLVGVATAGMGARIPAGGAAEQLGSLGLSGVVDLPVENRDAVMFGPSGVSEAGREAAHASYAPVPFVELEIAPQWARERLAAVATDVAVPVHNALGEFDALWDSSAEARSEFESMFAGGAGATTLLVPGVGHSIDHHVVGAALHLQQLAFAYACSAVEPTGA